MKIHAGRILYEDSHLLAVHKLSNELVVKGKGKVQKLALLDLLKKDYPGLRALQRLDYETSGVVIFAKTKAAHDAVVSSKHDSWTKRYRTLVMGKISRKKGTIRIPLPARGHGKVNAITHYNVLETFTNSTYVEADIETGRYHQIRKHFAAIHHPLVLDHVYGHKKFNKLFRDEFGYRDFFLHAYSVDLTHPITKKKIHIESPLPKTFEKLIDVLQKLGR